MLTVPSISDHWTFGVKDFTMDFWTSHNGIAGQTITKETPYMCWIGGVYGIEGKRHMRLVPPQTPDSRPIIVLQYLDGCMSIYDIKRNKFRKVLKGLRVGGNISRNKVGISRDTILEYINTPSAWEIARVGDGWIHFAVAKQSDKTSIYANGALVRQIKGTHNG